VRQARIIRITYSEPLNYSWLKSEDSSLSLGRDCLLKKVGELHSTKVAQQKTFDEAPCTENLLIPHEARLLNFPTRLLKNLQIRYS